MGHNFLDTQKLQKGSNYTTLDLTLPPYWEAISKVEDLEA